MNQEDTGKKRERDGQSGRGGKRGKGGWKKKNYGQKREFRQNKPNVWRQDNGGRLNSNHQLKPGEETNSYKLIPWELENAAFEEYYKGQQIMGEEEWETFMQTLRTQLPATFRINGTANFAKLIHHKLENDILQKMSSISTPSLTEEGKPAKKIIVEGEELEPLKKLSWYPNGYGWQMHYSRNQLRKLPVLQEFHEFLKRENEAGNITRQEAASMIPPFFMDVKPESRILDVCAAPGSKTFQLLEMVHAEQGKEPSGYVVANDSDAKRCNLLTHQTKRMCSPALIITNHEGEKFPHIVGLDGDQKNVIFDRILCDVPCSGDGTLRKAPDLWRRWNTGMGIALHKVQVKIVLKAAELLEIGGRLVYSTCSLNPIENEAVVAELLRKTQGALELIDVSNELPKLKRRPGMKKWRVQERGNWLESMPEEDDLTAPSKTNTLQSMYANEESDQMPLERCCRILPHDDNTGGFFISVFRKTKRWSRISGLGDENKGVKSVPQNVEKSEAVQEGDCKPDCQANTQEEGGDTNGTKEAEEVTPRPRRNYRFRGIDPVVHVKDEEILTSLKDFYGIGSSFPINEQLFSRTPSGAQPKRLYFISGSVKSVLDKDYFEKLRITSTGVKIFEKQTSGRVDTKYRIVQEGLPALLHHITKQIFRPTLREFVTLLKDRTLVIPEAPPSLKDDAVKEKEDAKDEVHGQTGEGEGSYIQKEQMLSRPKISDEETLKDFRSVKMGCCIAMMRDEDAKRLDFVFNGKPLSVACWRGNLTVNLLTTKNETEQLLEKFPSEFRTFLDPIEPKEEEKGADQSGDPKQEVRNVESL